MAFEAASVSASTRLRRSSGVMRMLGQHTLSAATILPWPSRIGAESERSPDFQLLIHDRPALQAHLVDDVAWTFEVMVFG
jgi:hypothetical protein